MRALGTRERQLEEQFRLLRRPYIRRSKHGLCLGHAPVAEQNTSLFGQQNATFDASTRCGLVSDDDVAVVVFTLFWSTQRAFVERAK